MITRIQALNFRSLRYLDRPIERFQVLVSPNGAGKSTFLDVIAFLGDLLKVGPRGAVLGDPKNGVPVRSADPANMTWMRQGHRFELAVELEIPEDRSSELAEATHKRARYEVAIQVGDGNEEIRFAAETLWLLPALPEIVGEPVAAQRSFFPQPPPPIEGIAQEPKKRTPAGWRKIVSKVADSGNDYFQSETSGWNTVFRLAPTKSALANLPEDEKRFPVATWVKRVLMEGIQRVVLSAEAIRNPSLPGAPRAFLPDGSNLPWVVEELKKEDDRYHRWLDHVRTALPDLKSVDTVERPEDRRRYLVLEYENGLRAPSWIVSDGTLRLLALTLLAFLPGVNGVYLIEEPENGIHPRAVETVYQSLSSVYEAQVLCASHSPVILGMARPADLLCFAKDETGATDVVRGDEHPRLRDWKGSLDLGTLFAAGVLG